MEERYQKLALAGVRKYFKDLTEKHEHGDYGLNIALYCHCYRMN